jgi:pimeloyl-ACP methyl ester carboxylesterase
VKKKTLILTSAIAAGTSIAALYKAIGDYTKKLLYRNEIERTELSDEMETIRLKNEKGLVLYGYLKEKEGAKRTLVMMHRLGENASYLLEDEEQLEKLLPDANVLLLDAAAHGTSDGYMRGFGYRDADDLEAWINEMIKRFGEDHTFVLYGAGMGANTALNAAGLGKLKNVSCIISDGAYDSVASYIGAKVFKKFKVNTKLSHIVMSRVFKNETGMNIDDMDTVRLVKNNTIPTIFMHSKEDTDVPFREVFELYNHNEGRSVLFPIKEEHFYDMYQEDDYSQILAEFLKENA